MDLDGAMDFEVDGGLEPIAPKLGGASDEAEGMTRLRDKWATGEVLFKNKRDHGTEEGFGEAIIV